MSFNYTEFLNKQNEAYVSKYGDVPVKSQDTILPTIGYGGFRPRYRGNVYDHQSVRSLMRCLEKKKEDACSKPKSVAQVMEDDDVSIGYSPPSTASKSSHRSNPSSRRSSRAASSVSHRSRAPLDLNQMPHGTAETLYGQSFQYVWPGEPEANFRCDSASRVKAVSNENMLTRQQGVIYRRYACLIPKYQGYVPGFKFRHGHSFGALTVNPIVTER